MGGRFLIPGADRFLAVGWDQSLNHAGVVALDPEGCEVGVIVLANQARHATRKGTYRIPKKVREADPDPVYREAVRLLWLRAFYREARGRLYEMAHEIGVDRIFVGIEDYAYRAPQGAHQLGEAGGMLVATMFDGNGISVRKHDPSTVKRFATGRGDAGPDDVRLYANRLGHDFTGWGVEGDYPPVEELDDAFVLASMVRQEVLVRAGVLPLADLDEHERSIFLRVTKRNPVNLLARPWIAKRGEEG
jgi:hypothetical protein